MGFKTEKKKGKKNPQNYLSEKVNKAKREIKN